MSKLVSTRHEKNVGTPEPKVRTVWTIPARQFRWVTAAGFMVATGLLVLLIGLAYQETRQQIRSSQAVIHSRDVLTVLNDFAAAAKTANTAVADYYKNGTESDVNVFAGAKINLRSAADRLRQLTANDLTEHKLTEDLNAQTDQALLFLQQVMDLRRSGNPDPTGIEATTKAAKPVSAGLTRAFEALVGAENDLLKERSNTQSVASSRICAA